MPLRALPRGLRRCTHRQPVLVIGNIGLVLREWETNHVHTAGNKAHEVLLLRLWICRTLYTGKAIAVVPAGALTTALDIAAERAYLRRRAGWGQKLSETPSFDGFPT